MGSPKKQKKKFSKPSHPWQKERILAEKDLLKEYGLNRKYEIWKMNSILKNFTRQAKNLITTGNPQVDKERSQLLTKLSSLGLTGKDAKIEDVLSLTLKDILERRLQTLVFRKNLANSARQARQFIVHEHVSLGEKTITAPSFLVPLDLENSIQFAQGSIISNSNHPIRVIQKKKKDEEKIKESKEKEIKEKIAKKDVKEKVEGKEKESKEKEVKEKTPKKGVKEKTDKKDIK